MPQIVTPVWSFCAAIASLIIPLIAPSASAQVIPDLTLPVNSQVIPGCTVCTIDGGTVRGVNLFHSFREFSIPTGGSARFNNSAQIQNILTRVTGNSISTIDGLLHANGTANLFLLNPNGIVFGQNARLQIGGSFFASTASSFKFPDGSEFSAINPQAPPLLTVNVPLGLQSGSLASGTIINRATLSAGQDLILEATQLDLQGQLIAGRDLTLSAQDTVQVRDTIATPFLAQAGRDLTIRGDRGINILALSHPGHVPFQSGGTLSLMSDGIVSGDAKFATGGRFQVNSVSGQPAQFVSLYDPIISAVGDVEIGGNYNGVALLVESLGSVRFNGSVTINGNDITFNPADPDPDLAALGGSNAFIVRAGRPALAYAPTGLPLISGGATFQAAAGLPASITIAGDVLTNGGPIILDTPNGTINTQTLLSAQFPTGNAGAISVSTGNGDITIGGPVIPFSLGAGNAGAVNIISGNGNIRLAGTLLAFSLDGNGGGVNIRTQNGDIQVADELNTFSTAGGVAGAIALSTPNGSITTNKLNAFTIAPGNGGTIQIIAGDTRNAPLSGNIAIGEVNTFAVNGSAGAVTFASSNGTIEANKIIANSFGGGAGGTVTLATTNGNIAISPNNDIQTIGFGGNGGNINVSTTNGTIATGKLFSYSVPGNGGTVAISNNGGDINLNGILSDSQGAGRGGNIKIANQDGNVTTTFVVAKSQSGQGGEITITADRGGLNRASTISSNGAIAFSEEGQGGTIFLRAADDIDFNNINTSGKLGSGTITAIAGGTFFSRIRNTDLLTQPVSPIIATDTFGAGRGGDIRIDARSVRIQDGAQISASTHGSGDGGNITIRTTDSVEVSGVLPLGVNPGVEENPAGVVSIPPGGDVGSYLPTGITKNGVNLNDIFPTGIFTQTDDASTGNAGTISIETPRLTVQDGAAIAATTFGQGNGGTIRLNTGSTSVTNGASILSGVATGSAGISGAIEIQTETLTLTEGLIQSKTLGRGNAGAIQITATNAVTLAGAGSAIRSGSGDAQTTSGIIGEGGSLRITAPTVEIRDRAVLSAETYTGSRGGSIFVTVDQFDAATGGQLRTTAFNSGQAGNIFVTAANQFTLANPETGLFANTAAGSTGSGGSIFVNTEAALIQQNSGIAVDSLGTGQGGNIQIQANRLTFRDRGFLTAETASAQGGNINLDIQEILLLRQNSLISATAGTAQGSGDGGNINIKALFIVGVLGENSDIRANAFTGNGGKINITAQGIFGLKFQSKLTPFSDITASSQFGINGTVILNLPNIDPNRGLIALPFSLADPSNQIVVGCSAGGQARKENRFIAVGRGGVPTSPEDSFGGSQVLVNLVETRELIGQQAATDKQTLKVDPWHLAPNASMVEAQGWAIAPNGIVSLIAQAQTVVPHSNWQPPVECLESTP
ncbi:filamentous hemagglutinin N-terminal domain-containing protein [Leptolyngbyaceae cyanobacterium UHCC 1019]